MADEKIFLSYSSDDKELAGAFYHLLTVAGFDAPGEGVFYDERSIVNGERFTDRILHQLKVAQSVVTLVTPSARQKTAVVAEMAIALAHNKLRPVAVPCEYQQQASWPFHLLQASLADKPESIEELLKSLAEGNGRQLTMTPTIRDAIDSFAKRAGAEPYQAPDERSRTIARWAALVAVFVLACTITAWLSTARAQQSLRPVQLVVTENEEQGFEAASVRLVYSGTFPARILSTRLAEVRKKTSADDQTVAAPIASMFLRALDEARKFGHFQASDALANDLKQIVPQWTGLVGGEMANEKGDCALTDPVDRAWCGAIRSVNESGWKKRFDNTEFAVVQIAVDGKWGDQFPVTRGSVVNLGAKAFRVRNIGRMSEEGLGGILHLQESKE